MSIYLRLNHLCLTICLSLGCASTSDGLRLTGPHYNSTVVRHAPFSKNQRTALVQEISANTRGMQVTHTRSGRTQKIASNVSALKAQPLYVLGALWIVLNSASSGAEMDLMIRIKGQNPTPVQVVWRRNTLALESGQRTTFPATREPKIGLRFINGSGKWTTVEKSHVRKAVKRLDPAIIRLLEQVPLSREKTKRLTGVVKGGQYEQKGCRALIRMYSSAFAGRHMRFTGNPSAPLSKTTATILHEVGHALHHAASRTVFCELERRNKIFEKERTSYNRAIRNTTTVVEAQQLQQTLAALEKEHIALQNLAVHAHNLSVRGPVLEAYHAQLQGRIGPTHYGASSVAESFAESFALYYGDPAALKRIWPDMAQWFEQKKHLRQK